MAEALVAEDLKDKGWFHPNASRQEAEDMLKDAEIGSFIVRASSRKDCYALTYIMRNGTLAHSLIEKTATGYKLPDEPTVYPTVTDLLRTCRFLKFEESVSDSAVATLVEAFPDTPQDALKRCRNDVNLAIDFLLRNASQPQSAAPLSPVVPVMSQLMLAPAIVSLFAQISHNRGDKKMAEDNWMHLSRPLENTPQHVSPTLETNLAKILQNTSHPMGKKLDMFVMAFNAGYASFPPREVAATQAKAVQEVHSFLTSMRTSIIGKVNEFNTPIGQIVVWKVLQGTLFPGIFPTLFNLFHQKLADQDVIKESVLTTTKNWNITEFRVTQALQPRQGSNGYYSSAVNVLKGLTFEHSVVGKLNVLVQVLQLILDAAKDIDPAAPSLLNAEALLPLFTFVLCKADVPNLCSEISFLLEFIPDALRTGKEAFALATLQASVNQLDKLLTDKKPLVKQDSDLISFEEVPLSNNKQATAPFDSPSESLDKLNAQPQQPQQFATLARVEKEYIKALKGMENVDSYNQLAVYYNTKGKMLKAIDYCNRALKLDPKNIIAMQNLAVYSNILISKTGN